MFTFGIVVEGVYDEQVLSALVEKIFPEKCRCLCRPTGGKHNLMKKFPGFLEEFRSSAVDNAGNGDAGNKVTKSYSINCNPFSRAMVSPLSTENPTPGELISNRLASS
ncbi:MAG: hypothetical protein KAT27_05815, partial [Desulfobacterales bacterium]|nr:hypothetical protein [Desulfobacterales bacterium]